MAYFDHFANSDSTATVRGKIIEHAMNRKIYEWISNSIGNNTSFDILEIGPGTGILARYFISNGFNRYDCIEPNETLVKQLPEIRAHYKGTVPPFCVPSDAYDAIIAVDMFEHVNGPQDAIEFVEECRRTLKNDGAVFLVSPEVSAWGYDFWNCDFSHNNITSLRRTSQLLYDYGFVIKSACIRYSHLKTFPGFFISMITRLLSGATIHSRISRLYKLRLSFLARFWICGQKGTGHP